MPNVPPHTPLRRVSHGSLVALARSQSAPDPDSSAYDPSAPSALALLGSALEQLTDEAEALAENAARNQAAADALHRFNEGFGAFMYATQMNMFGAYFPQAPIPETFDLMRERREEELERAELEAEAARVAAEETARIAAEEEAARLVALRAERTAFTEPDLSYAGDTTMTTSKSAYSSGASAKKRPGKRPLTAKEKKERAATIERVVMQLPLAFRGSDVSLRNQMEAVIEKLLTDTSRGFKLTELTAPPDLNEARARKCILALNAAKVVRSERGDAATGGAGTVLYRWVGLPDTR